MTRQWTQQAKQIAKNEFLELTYNKMKRTEEDWMRIQENAIYSILAGKCANEYFGNMSMDSLIDDAIWGADDLVEKLKERESVED